MCRVSRISWAPIAEHCSNTNIDILGKFYFSLYLYFRVKKYNNNRYGFQAIIYEILNEIKLTTTNNNNNEVIFENLRFKNAVRVPKLGKPKQYLHHHNC